MERCSLRPSQSPRPDLLRQVGTMVGNSSSSRRVEEIVYLAISTEGKRQFAMICSSLFVMKT